jgi:N-dimethylarginine dimethylaminohydrolase
MSLCWDHVGTTLLPLRPGKVLVNPERVKPSELPELFRQWDVIWAPPPVPQGYGLDWPRASNWVSMNVLSVDERHVIVEATKTSLMRVLEREGFTPIPVRYRHGRTFGGGFHCSTLDIARQRTLEQYFDSNEG